MVTGKRSFNSRGGHKERGAILITLIVIMVMLGLMIASFSTIMTTKHLSAPLFIHSTQSFYVAQAGVEWGIRYATDRFSDFTADPNAVFPENLIKTFSNGAFSITYDSSNDIFTSTGQVGLAQRQIALSSFSDYIEPGTGLSLIPGNPPYQGPTGSAQKNLYVPVHNYFDQDIYIFQIDVAKINPAAQLNEILFDGTLVWQQKKFDLSTDPNNPSPLSIPTYTMGPGSISICFTCQAAPQVSGTWYITMHYSLQSDLSDPQTQLYTITIL
ncbi:MAG: hypothetical protein ACMUIP_03855 [bacterium]